MSSSNLPARGRKTDKNKEIALPNKKNIQYYWRYLDLWETDSLNLGTFSDKVGFIFSNIFFLYIPIAVGPQMCGMFTE
jgi:hypothetical protein